MIINKKYINLTHISLFILIIWDALKAYLSLSSPLVQIAFLAPVVLVGFIDNSTKRLWKNIFSPPCSVWLLWIIYALINTFLVEGFHHHRNQNPFVFISAILISYLFVVIIVSTKNGTDELLNVIIWSYIVRLLLSYMFDTSGVLGVDDISRFGVEFNANSIAFGAIFIVILISIKKIRQSRLSKIDYLMLVMPIISIIITASKKTFLSLIIFAIGYVWITRAKHQIYNMVRYALFLTVLVIGFVYVINNTPVGKRMIDSFEKTSQAKSTNRMLDNRINQYITGWQVFLKNPINGVGLANYVYASGYDTPLHSEYMVQIAEGGIIGSCIFILYYIIIVIKLIAIRKISPLKRKLSDTHSLSLVIMFCLFFGGWIYNIPMMWVLVALAIRFIKEEVLVRNVKFQEVTSYQRAFRE